MSSFCWCGKRDLNPYGEIHTPLKRARLPVPPLPHATASAATYNIILIFKKMSIPFLKFLVICFFDQKSLFHLCFFSAISSVIRKRIFKQFNLYNLIYLETEMIL